MPRFLEVPFSTFNGKGWFSSGLGLLGFPKRGAEESPGALQTQKNSTPSNRRSPFSIRRMSGCPAVIRIAARYRSNERSIDFSWDTH
ncbi:MAG: hypothetical protein U9P12_02520 [Verrucomicrobiota bacterium]|nr:hypothetical protein [Verrucomicrobiota bacterium]